MSAISEIKWACESPKAEFNSFFEQLPVGLAQCRLSGEVHAWNPALERMLGARLESGTALTLSELIGCEDGSDVERQLRELFQGKRDSVQIDPPPRLSSNLAISWTAWRIPARNGYAAAVLAMAEVSRQPWELNERLQQAARLESLGKLAGGVVHDFNNVLTGVLLYCDLLMASLDSWHRARKYAEEIRRAVLQASGLVQQLLAMTRRKRLQPQLLSLNDVAQALRNLMASLVGGKTELQFRMDPKLGLVKLDQTQAQQMMLNLVLNARDAGGGHILVETRNCKLQALTESTLGRGREASLPCALFAVQDDGCGMDDNTRAHIFEPFFTTKTGKGTGLGLATVQEIVTSNGGLIHVASELGQGTRVSVFLPLACNAQAVPGTHDFYPQNTGEVLSSQDED